MTTLKEQAKVLVFALVVGAVVGEAVVLVLGWMAGV